MTNKSLIFHVSDDVRGEQHGKISLMGLYPSNDVRLIGERESPRPSRLPRLSFFALITVEKDISNATVEILSPDGTALKTMELPLLKAGGVRNIAVLIATPFEIPSFGEYRYNIRKRDEKVFTETFHIEDAREEIATKKRKRAKQKSGDLPQG